MTDNYAVFRKFSDPELARELLKTLENNNIKVLINDNSPRVDVTFTGGLQANEVELKIKQSDFAAATAILEKDAEELIEEIESDHYLFEFTDDELYQIILKPDEWCVFDYKLAGKILKDRGQEVNTDLLSALKNQRLKDLSEPAKNQKSWIIVGYFFATLGGIIGLMIGFQLWNQKKTLPNGKKVHAYSENDRKHGRTIFIAGLIVFITILLLRVYSEILVFQR